MGKATCRQNLPSSTQQTGSYYTSKQRKKKEKRKKKAKRHICTRYVERSVSFSLTPHVLSVLQACHTWVWILLEFWFLIFRICTFLFASAFLFLFFCPSLYRMKKAVMLIVCICLCHVRKKKALIVTFCVLWFSFDIDTGKMTVTWPHHYPHSVLFPLFFFFDLQTIKLYALLLRTDWSFSIHTKRLPLMPRKSHKLTVTDDCHNDVRSVARATGSWTILWWPKCRWPARCWTSGVWLASFLCPPSSSSRPCPPQSAT